MISLDVIDTARYVERITEIAVIVALFVGGLRLRLRWRDPAWYAAFALAVPVMILMPGDQAPELVGIVVSVIALSIVIHGGTAQPLLSRYERSLDD